MFTTQIKIRGATSTGPSRSRELAGPSRVNSMPIKVLSVLFGSLSGRTGSPASLGSGEVWISTAAATRRAMMQSCSSVQRLASGSLQNPSTTNTLAFLSSPFYPSYWYSTCLPGDCSSPSESLVGTSEKECPAMRPFRLLHGALDSRSGVSADHVTEHACSTDR